MKRGMGIGGLFLALFGWTCQAGAQEVVWRPTARPAELLPPTRLVALPDAGAALGRPTPIRPNAPLSDPAVVTASYHEMTAPTPVPRNLPDVADGPDASVGEFAAERPVRPALFSAEPIATTPRPGPAALPTPTLIPEPTMAPDAETTPEEPTGLFGLPGFGASRFYARGEYLLWWFKNDQTPPLVTTSAPADNGFLNAPTTRVLFGGDLGSGSHSGGRFTAGYWLDDCETKAIELGGFFAPGGTQRFEANSALFPVLARPFFSVNRNAQFAQLTAFPGVSTGNIDVTNSSNLWGLEANLRCKLCCGCLDSDDCSCCCDGIQYRIDGLVGFRYLNLNEDLRIEEHLINLPTAPVNPNVSATVFDDFATRNQFYGGQVGLDTEFSSGPWSLDVLGKLALGETHQQIIIDGGQTVTSLATGATASFRGGLLALPSNIGTHDRNAFSVVPEVDLTLSYHVNEHWRLFAGYDFLDWTNVVRPGEQIDTTLNEQQIPNFASNPPPSNAQRPAVLFRESNFWAQGIHLGLEFRY